MSQPPYPPSYPQDPDPGRPASGGPQGYPPQYGSPQPPSAPHGSPQTSGTPYGSPQTSGTPYGSPQTSGTPYGSPPPPDAPYGSPPPPGTPYGSPQTSGTPYGSPPPPDAPYGSPQTSGTPYGSPQHGDAPQYGGAPQYGSDPQYGGGQYGGTPPPLPPAKKKSSALKIVLIAVGIVALLCVAGAGVLFFVAKDKVEQVVDAASITVAEPATLGGRAKITDPSMAGIVSSLNKEMENVPGATGSVGAVYGDLKDQDVLMVVAASSINGSAQSRYDEFTAGLASGDMKINNLADVDPGPLGGIAKCGDTDSAGVPMALCVWSDNGSTGMFAMLFNKKAELEKEFVSLRGEVEHKN